jgi:hypothetical protein
VIEEQLVELDGPVGRCSSTAAIDVARRLAALRDGGARLHRVGAAEGIAQDGSATRWEMRFDLPSNVSHLLLVVTFTYDETLRTFGAGVASLAETAFPAPGSELERIAVSNGLSRRRIRGIWRQTMADHRPLRSPMPDAADVLAELRRAGREVSDLRSLEASVSRSDTPRWVVTGGGGRYEVRWSDRIGGGFTYSF